MSQVTQWLIPISILSGLAWVAQTRADDGTDATERSVEQLIQDLGAVRWLVREDATTALIRRGPDCYGPLRQAFREGGRYEVRRRIRQIVKDIYLTEALGPGGAFLGVSQPEKVTMSDDARIPVGRSALAFQHVVPETAADRAGLRRGDLIISLNGRWSSREYPADRFLKWMANQTPGTTCRLGILRGGEGVRLTEGKGGFTPSLLTGADLTFPRHQDDPRVPTGHAAILVQRVAVDSAENVLKAGDLILALDDRLIPAEHPQAFLAKWQRGDFEADRFASDGEYDEDETDEPDYAATAQILRGGEWHEIEVYLGRTPAWAVRNVAQLRSDIAPAVIDQTLVSFTAWWRGGLDSNGSAPEQRDGAGRWRLKPRRGW